MEDALKSLVKDGFAVFGIVSIFYIGFVGIHELGHAKINEIYGIDTTRFVILGFTNGDFSHSDFATGWVEWEPSTKETQEFHDAQLCWDMIWHLDLGCKI